MEKKRKRKLSESLGTKVALFLVGTVALLLFILTLIQGLRNFSETVNKSRTMFAEVGGKNTKAAEQLFCKTSAVGDTLKESLEHMLDEIPKDKRDREYVETILKGVVKGQSSVAEGQVYFEPNTFDGKDSTLGFFGRSYTKETDTLNKIERPAEKWYEKTLSSRDNYLGVTIIDNSGNADVYLDYPIDHGGSVIGIVALRVNLSAFQKILKAQDGNSKDKYMFITSTDGTIVAHSMDDSLIGKNEFEFQPAYKSIVDDLQTGKDGIETKGKSKVTGKLSTVYALPLNISGFDKKWVLFYSNTYDSFMSEARLELAITIIGNLIVLLFIGITIAVIMRKQVKEPVGLLEEALTYISTYHLNMGDIEKKAQKYIERKDEIGSAFRAGVAMTDNISELVTKIYGTSENLTATSEELTATAQSTVASSKDVSYAVENIAEGATSQAGDTQQAAESVEQVNISIGKMIVDIEKLVNAVDSIEELKNEGLNHLSELLEVAEDTNKSAALVTDVIMDTNQGAEEISKASQMIQSISDQTNLLALNAAIEAARAGDAGRGFAVVAEEIRKLAEESAGFTSEIGKVIDGLKVKTQSAVETMANVKKSVELQSEKLDDTKDNFNNIASALDESKKMVEHLSGESKEIEDYNTQIISIIENLSAIAEQNAASTQQASATVLSQVQALEDVSETAENLSKVAIALQEEVSKFEL